MARQEHIAALPAVALYRTEKSLAAERIARILDDAKESYALMLEREKQRLKGGRPKASGKGGRKNLTITPSTWSKVRRSDFTGVDPADALLSALGHFGQS